jgi:hypothetical protein
MRSLRPLVLLSILCAAVACDDRQLEPPLHAAYDAGPVAPLSCIPNLDGKIDANELLPALGIAEHLLVSPAGQDRMVDIVGKVDAQGRFAWDEASDIASDQLATIMAGAITGKWYAGSFPGATFVAPFDVADTVDAIYVNDASSIRLLGLASPTENPPEGKTLLVYAAPVVLFQFPLTSGLAYTSIGQSTNATVRGLPYAGKDTYDTKVDGAGSLSLPDFTFTQALRVRTSVTVEPAAGAKTTRKQVSFLFECFGEVMRATSKDNEPNDNFTIASEVRRLSAAP